MAVDYKKIYELMEDNVEYTASQLKVSPASLNAMSKRGLIEIIDTKPKKYKKKYSVLYQIMEVIKREKCEYFFLHKDTSPVGMLCSLKNNKVFDCWGKEYDITGTAYILANANFYPIKTQKPK